jgi:cytoskeletal protein RodZ
MAYDPNDPRKSFEYDEFSRRPSIDPAPAGFTGLVIGAIVVLGALIAFLMFRNDADTTQVGMNQPATQQTTPTTTPSPNPASPPSAAPTNPSNTGPTAPPAPTTPPANNN